MSAPAPVCPNFDIEETDPSKFFDGHSINWKRHYIGWGIAGISAVLASVISFRLIYKHARNYTKPAEQRHIMRIVLMIPIYAIISFLSYRFYKQAIYYETVRDCYEAFVIYSFFVLLLTYLGEDVASRKARITAPDRVKLVFPLNCFYYNPQSELFLYKMKYGVLQYVVIKPLTTIAAVVLEYKNLYCDTTYSFAFGKVYITIVNFIAVTVAMYCLVVFYVTIKVEIADKKPFLKFLCVKLVIFFCFWQTCVLSLLGHFNVFKATEFWSIDSIEIGISALLVCVEMVIFAILHVYSFSYSPYVVKGEQHTPVRKSMRDGFNPVDLFREIAWACKDIALIVMGRPLPVRDGHLSGAVQRANTVRRQNRKFRIHKDSPDGMGSTPLSASTTIDDSNLENGYKFSGYSDAPQQAPLLAHMDGRHDTNRQQQQQYSDSQRYPSPASYEMQQPQRHSPSQSSYNAQHQQPQRHSPSQSSQQRQPQDQYRQQQDQVQQQQQYQQQQFQQQQYQQQQQQHQQQQQQQQQNQYVSGGYY